MGVQLKLSDKEVPVSPIFLDFLTNLIQCKPFQSAQWHDQLTEQLVDDRTKVLAGAKDNAQLVMGSPVGQKYVSRAYELFLAILSGNTEKILDFQSRFHFINVIGIPRSGGTYLTLEAYRALGYTIESVPMVIAHDGFPEIRPFQFVHGNNSLTQSMYQLAEYFTMVEIFFSKDKSRDGKIVVPKKSFKSPYLPGFFQTMIGEHNAEHIITLRHPVASAISTYEKSGGLPKNKQFAIRSNIERLISRDLVSMFGMTPGQVTDLDYFDAYLHFWEEYHYHLMVSGIAASSNMLLTAYGKPRSEGIAKEFHDRFKSDLEPTEFKVFDKKGRHPQWEKKAFPVIKRVAEASKSMKLRFPLDAVMENS